jgi:membrane-bound lytic murein transglycosylase MltF
LNYRFFDINLRLKERFFSDKVRNKKSSSDAIDFIAAGMSVTEERKKNVDFSDPYYESKQVVIIRK